MARDIDQIFKGSDNTNEFILKKDGIPKDLSSVTRISMLFSDGTDVTNSTGDAWPIKWIDQDQTGLVVCQLGEIDLTVGELTAKLLTYDPVNSDGVVWSGQNGINFHVTLATAN
jgi:hypothetical protein